MGASSCVAHTAPGISSAEPEASSVPGAELCDRCMLMLHMHDGLQVVATSCYAQCAGGKKSDVTSGDEKKVRQRGHV